MTLSGTADFTVSDLSGDLDAAALSGDLTVTTADAADHQPSRSTAAAPTTDRCRRARRQQHPDADRRRAVTVTGLIANLDATALSGALDVTTGTVAGLSIATGSGANTINAQALTNDQVLTLTGNDAATVTLTAGDLSAPLDSGVLTVTRHRRRRQHQHHHHRQQQHLDHRRRAPTPSRVDAAALADDNTLTLAGRRTSRSPG